MEAISLPICSNLHFQPFLTDRIHLNVPICWASNPQVSPWMMTWQKPWPCRWRTDVTKDERLRDDLMLRADLYRFVNNWRIGSDTSDFGDWQWRGDISSKGCYKRWFSVNSLVWKILSLTFQARFSCPEKHRTQTDQTSYALFVSYLVRL